MVQEKIQMYKSSVLLRLMFRMLMNRTWKDAVSCDEALNFSRNVEDVRGELRKTGYGNERWR